MSDSGLASDAFARLRFPSQPCIAADGRFGVVVLADVVPAEGSPDPGAAYTPPRYRRRLWRVDLEGGDPTPLTHGSGHDTDPALSPDGRRLAFLRRPHGEDVRTHAYVLPLDGGEARPVTTDASHPSGIEDVRWHPSGDLVVLHKGTWRDAAADHALPRRVTRRGFRMDGAGFVPEVPSFLERIGVDGSSRGPGTELSHPPQDWVVGPDGRDVWALAATSDEERSRFQQRLLRVDLESNAVASVLDEPLRGAQLAAHPSDGRLAITGAPHDASAGTPDGLWIFDPSDRTLRRLADDVDVSPESAGDSSFGPKQYAPVWLDDERLLVATFVEANVDLVRVTVADGRREPITTGDKAISGFAAAGGRALMIVETPTRPNEAATVPIAGGPSEPARVSRWNDDVVADWNLRAPSGARRVPATDAAPELPYWVLEPAVPRDDRAVVLEVHGGPHTAYGYGFMFEFHLLAAHGYTVVYGNPRGGASYGRAYADAIHGRYGTVDADDVLAILDHALAAHVEPAAPVHLTGGSYGGFMTNWLLGQSRRFASGVSQRSICNWISFYGGSDIGPRFSEMQVHGTPWSDLATLWEQSPLRNVERIRTPLLLIHAEEDWRCPVGQAVELFQALDRLGRTVELFLVPGEGHDLSRSGRPDRRAARLDALLAWFAQHPTAAAGNDETDERAASVRDPGA